MRRLLLMLLLLTPGCVAVPDEPPEDYRVLVPVTAPPMETVPPATGPISPYIAPALNEPLPVAPLPPQSYGPTYLPSSPVLTPGAHLSYESPSYYNDPRAPWNRGRWRPVPGAPGSPPMRAWSTAPDRFRVGPFPENYPGYRGGYLPPGYRWNPSFRR